MEALRCLRAFLSRLLRLACQLALVIVVTLADVDINWVLGANSHLTDTHLNLVNGLVPARRRTLPHQL